MSEHTHADGTTHDHENSDQDHAHVVLSRDAEGNQVVGWLADLDDPGMAGGTTGPVVERAT